MKKKNYYADITVIEKRRIRVDFDMSGEVTKVKLLQLLRHQKYNDITDEETFDYREVLDFEVNEEEKE
jgi:hypothetical protein